MITDRTSKEHHIEDTQDQEIINIQEEHIPKYKRTNSTTHKVNRVPYKPKVPDISSEVQKRNEKLQKLKVKTSNSFYKPSKKSNLHTNDPERKMKNLSDKYQYFKKQNQELKRENILLNDENRKLLNELKQMRANMNSLTISLNKSVSRNEQVPSTSVTTIRANSIGKRRPSLGKLTAQDSNLRPKSKSKKRKTSSSKCNIVVSKEHFNSILKSLDDYQIRLQVPAEIMENNEALHIENSIIRQALSIYENKIPEKCLDEIHTLLGSLKPQFRDRELNFMTISNYWKDKTNYLIQKYTKVIKSFKAAFHNERKENVQILSILKNKVK